MQACVSVGAYPSTKGGAMRRTTGAFAAVLCAAGLIAGCGGSARLSKAEFLKKGNAICAKGNAEIQAAGRKQFTKPPTPAQLVPFVKTTVIPSVQRQIDQVRKLKPPKSDEATVKDILDSAQAALDKAKANPLLLATNGPGPFAEANRKAKAYGLTTCGSS